MKYTGVIARINGEPDRDGEVMGPNVVLPNRPVNVTLDFDKEIRLGTAIVKRRGTNVVAELNINFPAIVATKMYGVIGGKVLERDGKLVKKWEVTSVGLTLHPVDKSLPKLRQKRK